jgi:hypothetical protein
VAQVAKFRPIWTHWKLYDPKSKTLYPSTQSSFQWNLPTEQNPFRQKPCRRRLAESPPRRPGGQARRTNAFVEDGDGKSVPTL